MKSWCLALSLGVLLLLLDSSFEAVVSGMKFSLLNKQSRDSSPSISVTFPDGYSDELVLWNYYSNNKDRIDPGNENNCNYFGHLANEKSACAAMTGCIGSEDVLFTIMSDHAPGSFNFIWTKEGKVDIVDPDEFNAMNGLKTPDLDISDFTKAQNLDLKTRAIEDEVCYFLKPPATALLNVKVAFDEGVYDSVGRNFTQAKIQINRAFAHIQAAVCHPSLGVKIHINIEEIIFLEGVHQTYIQLNPDMNKRMKDITGTILEGDDTTHLVIYILPNVNGEYGGGGEALSPSPCNPNPRGRFILNGGTLKNLERIVRLVLVVRHELGHAMGMMEYGSDEQYPSWDCGTKGNVMYGDNIGAWSRCNAMDFRRMYTKFHDNWCMPEYPTACSAGEPDKIQSYFQIQDKDGNALKQTSNTMFKPNDFDDNQFWYLQKLPNSDYGLIGSRKYASYNNILTIKGNLIYPGLIVKTGTGYYPPSKNAQLFVTLCQDNACCTATLPPQYPSGKRSHYNFNQLGNCSEFDFKNDSMQGNITTDAAGSDEWNGKWIKLMLNDGVTIIECLIEGYVGGGSMKSVDLNCNPKALTGWNKVELSSLGSWKYEDDVKDTQLWKKSGNTLVSKYNDAILSVHETEGLVSSMGNNAMVTPATIDETAEINHELGIPDCPNKDILPFPNGTFEITNMITGKYLTVESDVVSASDSHQGGFSQWIWEPRTGNNPDSIWGFIRSLTAVKNNNPNAKMYLAIGNDFICVPEAKKGCDDEVANIELKSPGHLTKSWTSDKLMWRRVGNQIVSGYKSMERGGARRSPYILGEKSDDNIFAIRAIARDGANGEWSLSKDTGAGPDLKHPGEYCWPGCGGKQGFCDWCGSQGLCCKKGYEGNGCDGEIGITNHHGCVFNPDYSPTTTTLPETTTASGSEGSEGSDLQHEDEDCWGACHQQEGYCGWCGDDGLCCRKGWEGNGCDGEIGGHSGHKCAANPGPVFDVQNAGKDCWNGCNQQQGLCDWCGSDGICCRKG